jgi:putative DNA primase/helicase
MEIVMAKDRNILSVIFRKSGIFIKYGHGEELHIGDPIRVLALGTGIQDKLAYTVLELQDRDKRWRKAVVRSSLLTARTTDFKEQLTDVYNYRLPTKKYAALVIDELAAKNPERRMNITAVPGWQGQRYAHPRKLIKPEGDDWACRFADNPNVLMGEFLCKGALAEWKKEVARYCRLSSRLRLAVGVPFAAAILHRLNIDTFGFHLVGTTSSGKTLCLRVAGSVPGFNSEAGVTTWDGTPTGLEQLALGRRHNVLPLDETGVIEGDEKRTADFLRLSAYRLAKNRQKHRAGEYARRHTVDSDLRNIVLSTGEDVLQVGRRLSGQDVRLIQIPACVSDSDDIFDPENASEIVGKTTDQRERFVNTREAATYKFQGVALIEFLSWLIDDNYADRDLKRAVEEFIAKAPIPQSQSRKAFARMRRRVAAVYAAMALAIDYGILPFSKEETLRDLRICMKDAINLLIENEGTGSAAPSLSDDALIAQFRERLIGAKFIKGGAYAKRKNLTAEQIEAADGFINFSQPGEYRVMVQTRCLRHWHSDEPFRNRLITLLRDQGMIFAGRQSDTCARQVSLKPHSHKISVYWLSLKALGLGLENLQVS